jgi:hypothetical protein
MVAHARMLVLATVVLAAACATKTSTTQLWQAEGYAPRFVENVLVFGGRMAEPMRRSLEDEVAKELADRGTRATPSYKLFPQLPQRDIAQPEVRRLGFDAAIVATLSSIRERQTFVPGHYHYGGFWGAYYGPGWGMTTWSPGYVVTDELVNVDTTLWDLRTEPGNLVWTTSTTTRNPTSTSDFVESFAGEVAENLERARLVRQK